MVLTHDGRRFVARTKYHERNIPKSAGFRWDPERRVWWTADVVCAMKLAQYADDVALEALERAGENYRMSVLSSAEVDIPCPPGLSYLPYQKAGILAMAARRSVLLADQMGLGKTIEVIGLANLLESRGESVTPWLIVCPACVKINWKRELDKWLVVSHRVDVLGSGDSFPPDPEIVVVNYDVLHRFLLDIRALRWAILVADEAHYVKNPKARRSRSLLGSEDDSLAPVAADRRLMLTGTPIMNHPIEVWPLVHYLDPQSFPSFWEFVSKYTYAEQGTWGWDFSRVRNLEDLHERLRCTVMIRRTKDEVMPELPPKLRQVIELDIPTADSALRREREVLRECLWRVDAARIAAEAVRSLGKTDEWRRAMRQVRDCEMQLRGSVAEARHHTALLKVPQVVEHLRLCIESSGKIVCWAHHHDVIDAIHEEFGSRSVRMDGRMDERSRQESIDRFQSSDSVELMVASITAGGVGVNLTASSHVVFAELDWVPARVFQAEDRSHRIGTKNSVLVQYLVLPGSVDSLIASAIMRKQDLFERVTGDLWHAVRGCGGVTDETVRKVRDLMGRLAESIPAGCEDADIARWLSHEFSGQRHVPVAVELLSRWSSVHSAGDLCRRLEDSYLSQEVV